MAFLYQALHCPGSALRVLGKYPVKPSVPDIPVNQHHRNPLGLELLQPGRSLLVALRHGNYDQTFYHLNLQGIQYLVFPLRILSRAEHEYVVIIVHGLVGYPMKYLTEKRILNIRDHERYVPGYAHAQIARHHVGGIILTLDDFQYLIPCLLFHVLVVVQNPGNGGRRNASLFGNIIYVHTLFPYILHFLKPLSSLHF